MTIEITITTAGYGALINAKATGTDAIAITAYGISQVAVAPTPDLTVLPNELKRIDSVSGGIVAPDTIHVVLQDLGDDAYSMRAFGLYLSDGTLFAVYGQVDPILIKTASSNALLATDIQFTDIDASNVTFGATNFFNPPATETVQGVAEIATQEEANTGSDDKRFLTPAKARAAILKWLGFTPIQQGTGIGQGRNTIKIGWSGSRLKVTVDTTDQGYVATDATLAAGQAYVNGTGMARKGLTLWGPDNDGSGSGLDADTLDGLDSTGFAKSADFGFAANATVSWEKRPNGIIEQSGTVTIQPNGTSTISVAVAFAIAFPNRCFGGNGNSLTTARISGWNPVAVQCLAPTKTGMTINIDSTDPNQPFDHAITVFWRVLGN